MKKRINPKTASATLFGALVGALLLAPGVHAGTESCLTFPGGGFNTPSWYRDLPPYESPGLGPWGPLTIPGMGPSPQLSTPAFKLNGASIAVAGGAVQVVVPAQQFQSIPVAASQHLPDRTLVESFYIGPQQVFPGYTVDIPSQAVGAPRMSVVCYEVVHSTSAESGRWALALGAHVDPGELLPVNTGGAIGADLELDG